MSDSSLIPERQLVFSPALAETLGLEEAILLQHLNELFKHRASELRRGYAWLQIERSWLLATLPFWSAVDLHRVTKSLADKGVILMDSPPLHDTELLVFAVNETPSATRAADTVANSPGQTRHTEPAAPRSGGAGLIGESWTPSDDLLHILGLNHGIPRQFAIEQLEDFVYYWRERGEISHAWENKFRQHVLSRWRNSQQSQAERFALTDDVLSDDWYPSADALEILERNEVARHFIDDAVPEFVLYWREHNPKQKALNSKFIQHIRRQWARYSSSLAHDTEPQRIAANWQPTEDVFDILQMSHIDTQFALELVPSFVLYWKDSNQLYASWNTKFLQHVKYHWAKRNELQTHGGQQGSSATGRSRDRSLSDDLSDRSWAH